MLLLSYLVWTLARFSLDLPPSSGRIKEWATAVAAPLLPFVFIPMGGSP